MKKKEPDDALMQLAGERAGVLTRADLLPFDRHDRAMRRWIQSWTTLAPGFYCTQEPTWDSWCWAGLLRAGDTGVVSGEAAGYLHGFVKEAPKRIVIHHRRERALAPMGHDVTVQFRRSERAGRLSPARASVEVALLDMLKEADEQEVIMAVTRALADRFTTGPRVLAELAKRERSPRRGLVERLCEETAKGVESVLEWRFLELVVRAHGLPEPQRQATVVDGTRSDNLWEEFGLVVELDGRLGHEDKFRDMQRDNRAMLKGYTTLRYGWHDVLNRPCEVAAEILTALQARGWVGVTVSCPGCRAAALA